MRLLASHVFFVFFCIRFPTLQHVILEPTWSQLGVKLASKIDQKSFQEPFKFHPQSHLVFLSVFGSIFNGFLIDFRPPHPSKNNRKSIDEATQQYNNQQAKESISYNNLQSIRALGHFMFCCTSNENRFNILRKIVLKSMPQIRSIVHQTWLHFGSDFASNL